VISGVVATNQRKDYLQVFAYSGSELVSTCRRNKKVEAVKRNEDRFG
jgi:hypothetical protein